MKVLLLDAKEFAKTEGKVFLKANYYSFFVKNKVEKIWSNGWCPISKFKVDAEGNIYGRIANELVPSGYYNNVTVETDEKVLINRYRKAIA